MSKLIKAFNRKIINSDDTRVTSLSIGETYDITYKCTISNNESESQSIMVSANYYDDDKLIKSDSIMIDVPVGESDISKDIMFTHKGNQCKLKVILLDSEFSPICGPSILPSGDETSLFIYNGDDFSDIRYNLGNNYKLIDNIFLNNYYEPFEFYGNLDGDNYTITYNIDSSHTSSVTQELENLGLFSRVLSNSSIRNLRLTGSISSNSTINMNIGSLAGKISGITNISIENILSTVNISYSKFAYVGGIIGNMYQQTTGNFNHLIYEGEFNGTLSKGSYVGGIVGISSVNLYNCISICTFSNIVSSDSCAGIVSYMYGNTLYKCASKMTFKSFNSSKVGSMVWNTRFNINLRYCYNTQNIDMIYSVYSGCSANVLQSFTSGKFITGSNTVNNTNSYSSIVDYESCNYSGFEFGTVWENTELTYHPVLIDEFQDFYNYQLEL